MIGSEPDPTDNENLSVTVKPSEPGELTVYVSHPSGSDVVESGTIETVDGTPLAVFEEVRDGRWTANLLFEAVEDAAELEFTTSQDVELFVAFETKWGVVSDVELTARVGCDGRAPYRDGECLECAGTNPNGECVVAADCVVGTGQTVSFEDLCAAQGLGRCDVITYEGEDGVNGLSYDGEECGGQPTPISVFEVPCITAVTINPGFSIRPMCVP